MTRRGLTVALGLALVWGAGAVGCSVDLLPPPSELGDEPQMLTIRVEPPEAHPGDVVTLDAVVHWPGDDWEAHWLVCVPQSSAAVANCVGDNFPSDGVVPDCLTAPPDATLCRAPSGRTTQILVPPYLELPPDASFPVFVELLAARTSEGWSGCAEALARSEPTSDCLLGLKTAWISSDPAPNTNPVPVALLVDGVTHDASAPFPLTQDASDLDSVSVLLELVVDASSVDEIHDDEGLPVDAELSVAWFVTCGTIDTDSGGPPGDSGLSSANVNCTPPAGGTGPGTCTAAQATWKPREPGTCVVHAVVMDGRGGVGHLSRIFEVRGTPAAKQDRTFRACSCRTGPEGIPPVLALALLLLGWLLWRRARLSRRADPG